MNICFFRVDANNKIGYGHLSRCRIIADELIKASIKSVFLVHDTDDSILEILSSQNYEYRYLQKDDPKEIISCKDLYKARKYLLIFDTDIALYYEKVVQLDFINAGFKLSYFTFWDHYTYLAHIIINQNPLSLTHHYHTADYTRKLVGPEYMIFDDQFINLSIPEVGHEKAKEGGKEIGKSLKKLGHIETHRGEKKGWDFFLSFGGTDIPDTTTKTIKALEILGTEIRKCNIIIGALYKHEKRLYHLVENCSFDCHIYKQILNISEIMLQSNIAISSGGLTLWELSVLNIPTAVISYSEREKMTADYLDKKGWTYHMGQAEQLDPIQLSQKIGNFMRSEELRNRTISLKDQININGKKRIVNELIELLHE